MSLKFSLAAITFALAASIAALPQNTPSPTASAPTFEITKPACNTSIPLNNPVCGDGFTCVQDPDIFCIQVFPNVCLDGMCVANIEPTGPIKSECNVSIPLNNPMCGNGLTCVENPEVVCIDPPCQIGICVANPEPKKPACNTSIPLHNPVCGEGFACVEDPDIFCIQPVPNPCLNGMCVANLEPSKPACNTSIPLHNPVCGEGFICAVDPDIICNLPLPNPCLNGRCLAGPKS
ncbi:MAG: hypothetical protein Q9195_007370 [Heterodermia aff. obscurata]